MVSNQVFEIKKYPWGIRSGSKTFWALKEAILGQFLKKFITLESVIDVGQGITVGQEKFDKLCANLCGKKSYYKEITMLKKKIWLNKMCKLY